MLRIVVVTAALASLACGFVAGCVASPPLDDSGDEGPEDVTDAPPDAGIVADAGSFPVDAGTDDAGTDAEPEPTDAGAPDDDVADAGPGAAASCFTNIRSHTGVAIDYDQFAPVVGSHCVGTNHQQIAGIERVVFLGDSVTVGTPPTSSSDVYRARLADALAQRFGLDAPGPLWKSANPLSGVAGVRRSGDFWSCAKWGARADDLMEDGTQIVDCFPPEERSKKTLVVMTMGGNDIAAITKAGADGMPVDDVRREVEAFVSKLRDAIVTLKDPVAFPGGVDIVFSNNFEFTDGTGDVSSCPAAGAAGFDRPWEDPTALARLVVWATEQYMSIAVETGSDLLFMLETFCGHGYNHDDASNGCYRGPDAEQWFDLSCIHPNPTGHEQIANMILSIVDE